MRRKIERLAGALLLLLAATEVGATSWQKALAERFDIVETFDELQEWSANGLHPSGSGDPRAYDASLLPKKLDGSRSIWGYWNNKYPAPIVGKVKGSFLEGEGVANGRGAIYQYRQSYLIDEVTYLRLGNPLPGSAGSFSTGDTLTGVTSGTKATITGWPKIIANHGSNSWRESGKSLVMNLGDNDNMEGAMAGLGAQRLGLFFGDGVTGKSGYKKIHVFMMVKFAPTFFGASGASDDVEYLRVFKFFDICSGFTSIRQFGAAAEQRSIRKGSPQTSTEYGANVSIINLDGGGLSNAGRAFFTENISAAHLTPGSDPPTYYELANIKKVMRNNDRRYASTGSDVNRVYPTAAAGEWFGIEIISDIGTPDKHDGSTELYVYNKEGKVKGHYETKEQLKLVYFDHKYNKITLGGNRRTGKSTSKTDGRYWIDDFIIHSSRIGPDYFWLLTSQAAPTPTVSRQRRGGGTPPAP